MNVAHVVGVAWVAGGILIGRDCVWEELDSRGFAGMASLFRAR